MKIGPKYKIARRLGAPVFEKTQTQKYTLHLERRGKKGFSKPKSEFGTQLNEKQKARFVYCLSERQFSNTVREALGRENPNTPQVIFELLETRLDNAVYRAGFAPTRLGAKQMVSHGHIKVNGRKVDTPSMRLKIGDKFEINDRSVGKPLFSTLDERLKTITVPAWIKMDFNKKIGEVVGKPQYIKTENMFDLNAVVEFYSR